MTRTGLERLVSLYADRAGGITGRHVMVLISETMRRWRSCGGRFLWTIRLKIRGAEIRCSLRFES
jgi:hypothetical protein